MACALPIAAGAVAGADEADEAAARSRRHLLAGVLLATALVLRAGLPCHDAPVQERTDLSPLAIEALIARAMCLPLDPRAGREAPAVPRFDGDPPLCLHGGGTTPPGTRAGACRAARRRLPLSVAETRARRRLALRATRTTAHRPAR